VRPNVLFRAAGAALLAGASAAQAAVVDFNALPDGDAPNPYSSNGATFATAGGFNVIANAFGSPSLCPSVASNNPANCSLGLEVTFANPVAALSFTFAGNNQTGIGADIGDVQVFSGATLLGTTDVLVVDNNAFTFDLVSLGAYNNVTRLFITSTDFGGVLYDDFTWQRAAPGVPEPATWAMLILGFGFVGGVLRRRTSARVSYA